ncbi:MAG: TonB-dependent receptor, partial [bacterium]|nr:TonB-dependent receptor [bacterium]
MALALSVTSVILTEVHAQEVDATSDPTQPSQDEPRATLSDEIVVTANRLEAPAETVGSSVTVITAEEIARRRKTSVAELLRTVPGIEVARSGGPGQVTSLFIRGGNSSHALVLVDGVRVNSATTGAFDFADLPADAIERIEIVRGPQSTLYGSEAVAGVVSITTRRGSPGFHVAALAEAGGDDH